MSLETGMQLVSILIFINVGNLLFIHKIVCGEDKGMNIGIDVDGVLTDFEWFIDYCGEKFLKSHKLPYDIVDETAYSFAKKFNCTNEVEKSFYTKYLIWYAKHIPIRENAAKTIKCLKEKGNNIYIITARVLADQNSILGFYMRLLLKKWLKQNGVCYDNIYFVNFENCAQEKVRLCQELKLDWFIEDTPDNIIELRKCCQVICISSKYNMNLTEIHRAINFAEVFTIIYMRKSLQIISHSNWQKMKLDERESYLSITHDTLKNMPYDCNTINKCNKYTKMLINIIRPVFRSVFFIQVYNINRLRCNKNAIYVCNHRRGTDILIAYFLLNDIYARFLSKREYQYTKFGFLQKRLGTIWVDRNNKLSSKDSQIVMMHSVINNENIFIFPEGTRNKTDSILLPFKYGAVKVAQITNRPIIPIIIYEISKFKYRITIENEFNVTAGDDLEDKNNQLWNIMKTMYIHLEDNKLDDNWCRL